jgi:hypothetical protein
MKTRKALSKKTRFEVLKRDKFTCRYCGAQAPKVILHIDHIKPVIEGGSDDLMNLITACQPCNSGKGRIPLDNESALDTSRAQADENAARLEQLQQMAEWHHELMRIDDDTSHLINCVLTDCFGFIASNATLRDLLRRVEDIGIQKFMSVCHDVMRWRDHKMSVPSQIEIIERIKRQCGWCACETDAAAGSKYIGGILRNRFQVPFSEYDQLKETIQAMIIGGRSYHVLLDSSKKCADVRAFIMDNSEKQA